MVKSPGHRDHAVLQFPGERRNRGAHRVFHMGHRGEVEPRQTAGADKMLAIDDERRRRCLSCRDDLWRCRGAEGGELGGVVAPYRRKPSSTVITGVMTARLSYSITSPCACAVGAAGPRWPRAAGHRARAEKRDPTVLRTFVQALRLYRNAEIKAGVGKLSVKVKWSRRGGPRCR